MTKHYSWIIGLLLILSLNIATLAQAAPDRDGDGVPDATDRCISDSGPASNNGCPLPATEAPPADRDGDGVADANDQCADTYGSNMNNGCPLPESSTTTEQATPEPTPSTTESISLPVLPTTGDCVVATATSSRVNARQTPALDADIIGVLEPSQVYPAYIRFDGVDGESIDFIGTALGFIAASAIRLGGDCSALPAVTLPTSTGPFTLDKDSDSDSVPDSRMGLVALADVLGTNRTDYDPTDQTIFWPPINDDPEAIGLLLPAVQKVREASSATLGDGCDDVLIFDPTNPSVPGCVFAAEDFSIWCMGDYCLGQQTTRPQLPSPIIVSPTVPTPAPQTREHILLAVASPVEPASSPIPTLIFVPQPPNSNSDDDSCAPVEIGVEVKGVGVSVEGCLILTMDFVAFCISEVCLFGEW